MCYITIHEIYLVEVVGCVQEQDEGLGEKQTFLQNSKNKRDKNVNRTEIP